MSRQPTDVEQRIAREAYEYAISRPVPGLGESLFDHHNEIHRWENQADELRAYWIGTVRFIIREMRIATPAMLSAMGAAMYKSGLKRGGHVTATLKHQLRWAAAIDTASPPMEKPE